MTARTPRQSAHLGHRLLRYTWPYRKGLALALVLILIVSALINYLPIVLQQMIDRSLLNQSESMEWRLAMLVRLSGVYLLITLAGYGIRYGQGLLTAWIGQRVVYDLRTDVFRKALRMQQSWFDRMPVGALMTRVTSDVERLQNFVTEGVVGSIADLFMLFGIAGYMVLLSPRLTGVLFGLLPPLFALLYLINQKLRHANRLIRQRQSELNSALQEDLAGMTTLQLFNREQTAIREFDAGNRNMQTAHVQEVRWFSLYFPLIETSEAIAVAVILAAGGAWMVAGTGGTVTMGTLIAFLACIRQFFNPLGSLSDKAGSFQIAMASAERLFGLMDLPEMLPDPVKPKPPSALHGTIAFDHVSFAYEADTPVIRDLSFRLEPGTVMAVVGATGAGKSTLINLMGRFYDPQSGSVTINGIDVREFSKAELRGQIGFVFQDPFIFAGSVADNISLRDPEVSREQLVEAAHLVNAHGFISVLPEGYDTVLHERGAGLSLGQKQLLVMARAIVRKPELLLVLDEATASIDTATEMLIQDALANLMKGRTCMVIAHRLSTIRNADHILVMRHGQLIDQGSHEELIARDGYYRTLCDMLA